jgi:membrane protease YdiL (CAAX protease family)
MTETGRQAPQTASSALVAGSWLYLIMASVGFTLAYSLHGNVETAFAVTTEEHSTVEIFLIATMIAGVLLCLNHAFEYLSSDYAQLRKVVADTLGHIPIAGCIYLAGISAVGEELLFRAGLQPFLGLFFTSILFGLLHLGPGGIPSMWSLWAFLSGMLLGWSFENTGSLWPAILAHFFVNAFSLIRVRRAYLKDRLSNGMHKFDVPSPNDEQQ